MGREMKGCLYLYDQLVSNDLRSSIHDSSSFI